MVGRQRHPFSIVVLPALLLVLSGDLRPARAIDSLPIEPDVALRVDEIYDHESRLLMMLYSLKGDGKVDYITGRSVLDHARSHYGNPVYFTEPFPLFYWWNHQMWNDPDRDGVNGNEKLYLENVEFDVSRYKPCLFNGQVC